MNPPIGRIPCLVALAPSTERGRQFELSHDRLVVGRDERCDIRFGDPCVSRTHAELERRGAAFYVRDLGSVGGTRVNGRPAAGTQQLRHGDVLRFAGVEVRFIAENDAPAAHYEIGYQSGNGVFNNVARDQHIWQQRESFLRHVAATKTKASWLIWFGVVFTVVGTAVFASSLLRFWTSISDAMQTHTEPAFVSPFGADIGGVPAGFIGWAMAGLGPFMIVIGVVLHVVAASRRKRVDRDFPLPQFQ